MTKVKQAHSPPTWSPISPSAPQTATKLSPGSGRNPLQSQPKKPLPASYPDDNEEEDEEEVEQQAFWEECEQVAKKNPAPSKAGGGVVSGKGNEKGKKISDKVCGLCGARPAGLIRLYGYC